MAECSFARCQQERRAIRKELQRWTKNMVYILGLERVAEELMGRRKWKQYQDTLIPKRNDGEPSSDEDSMPSTDPSPGLKIKTIEQINEDEPSGNGPERSGNGPERSGNGPERSGNGPELSGNGPDRPRRETILESLIKRPATQPKMEMEEPTDWKPADKCYFCVDGDRGEPPVANDQPPGGATSPLSESDSSSVSGRKSPPAPALLQHLLQLHTQNPQAIAQFQQMLAALTALGGLVPPALSQAWMMPRLMPSRPQVDRLPDNDKDAASPSLTEQPLDLSAKSTSSTSGTPPPEGKILDNRLKRPASDCPGAGRAPRRAYSEEELQAALRDIHSGKLGTRGAAAFYNIPRSTLRNKVSKLGPAERTDSDSEPDRADSPHSVILKIPTFPPPDDKSPSPAAAPPHMPPIPAPCLKPPSQLLLSPAVFADPPANQHLYTLSEVIAKSISQKFQQPAERAGEMPAFMRAPERHVSVIKTPPEQRYGGAGHSRAPPNGQAGGKGTRPKRGKYRNYDRDSLVEAVKAVQRGEMSVHRAGSYYGVPHSTLEYKVKERHLMRPRKREPKPPPDVKPAPPKPPPKPAGKFANGMNGPEPYGGFPFPWGGAAPYAPPAPELYASHMMRRLREEAPPPNGSYLEGIIRSSLERPNAALLARLAEEPTRRGDGALAADMRDAVQRLRADKRRASPEPEPRPPDADRP